MHKSKVNGGKKLKLHNEPTTKVLFTFGDQMNSINFQELQKCIDGEKPSIIAICEVKLKSSAKERSAEDYEIPDNNLHPINLQNSELGLGVAV